MAHIFLTGGTGEIGREVLPRLLRDFPGAGASVLVRGRDRAHAAARLRDVLRFVRYHWPRLDLSRVRLLRGDLEAPLLGLGPREYLALAGRTTHVVHCAASIRLDLPLACARAINVGGTRGVLDLAERCPRLEAFAHLSTAYVAGDRRGVVLEEDLDRGQGFLNTYERSKFESEAEVRSRRAGLPATVLRPSIVVGDSRDGHTGAFSGIHFPLRAVVRGRLRSLPCAGSATLDLVPVDFVAEAVAVLLADPRSRGETYQLVAGPGNEVPVRRLLEEAIRIAGDGASGDLSFAGAGGTAGGGGGRMAHFLAYLDGGKSFDDARLRDRLDRDLLARRDPGRFLGPMLRFCAATRWGARLPWRDGAALAGANP